MKKYLAFLLVLVLLLWGCGTEGGTAVSGTSGADDPAETAKPADAVGTEDLFSNRDLEGTYDEGDAVAITLSGSTASCDSRNVTIDGSTVTITGEGVYVLTGSLDGMVIVDATNQDKVQLVLDGASITSASSAAIYVRQADKVFLTLAEGSENSLSNGGSFEAIDENNIDSVIFAKDDITLNGTGSLTIESPAGHGIVSKDELTITGGSYTITTASHGMTGKDCISIADASITIAAGKDGIQADNDEDAALGFLYIAGGTFDITAEGDGLSASASLQIDGGSFNILAGGGSENGSSHSSSNWGGFGGGMGGGMGAPGGMGRSSGTTSTDDSTSMKGIKSGTEMAINGGTFNMDCADDAIHSNTSLTVTGGTFTIASGDDGIHAEDTLSITSGDITITESYEGLEALHILISGGDIDLASSDDGLNAAGGTDSSGITGGRDGMFGGGGFGTSSSNGSIVISGGDLYINASGDGIDANGTLEITGGYTVVVGPTQGDTATLDYDLSAVISGGTFIGTGASGMAQTFSSSVNQGVFAVQVGTASAGTQITLTDSKGNVVISYTPELNYNVVILSSPDIIKGESYTITVGTASGTFNAS